MLFCMSMAAAPKAEAQDAFADYALQLRATATEGSSDITLHWDATSAGGYTIYRRDESRRRWFDPIATLGANATEYVDTEAASGTLYEYKVERETTDRTVYGYLFAGTNIRLPEDRGTVLVLVDDTVADALEAELAELQIDLRKDGWKPVVATAPRNGTAASTKALIVAAASAHEDLNTVYLLGHVPNAFSGYFAPDAHEDRPFPTDGYYADLDGEWTDERVNESGNVAGDGIFDQEAFPSELELAVGRVDMFDMPAFQTNGETETDLLRRYLDKAHRFRTGEIQPERRAAYYADNEWVNRALAARASRNFVAMFGTEPTAFGVGEYLSRTETESYMWTFVSGFGSPDSVTSIGSHDGDEHRGYTSDFAAQPSKVAFSMLLGSYFLDWTTPSEIGWFTRVAPQGNLLRAQICGEDYGLGALWPSFPEWFVHSMAMGEPIGLAVRRSQNNDSSRDTDFHTAYDLGLWGTFERGVHMALMGDPTIRQDGLRPASGATAAPASVVQGVDLAWTASPDATRYRVYRATSEAGPYVYLAETSETRLRDSSARAGEANYYMIKATALLTTGSGTYWNASLGTYAGPAIGNMGTASDAGPIPSDGSVDAGTSNPTGSKNKGGCSVSSRASNIWLLALGLVGLMFRRSTTHRRVARVKPA